MPHGPVIEQMKLSEKGDVLSFLSKAYFDNPRQSDRRFWDWHFLEPPLSHADDLPVWLAKSDGRIVGHLAAIPVELNVGPEAVRAIWILDLIVNPASRRQGIAKKLAVAARDAYPFVLGINTTKQHSTAVLESLGFVVFTKVPRFQKVLFPGNALPQLESSPPLRSLANIAFAPFRPGVGTGDDRIRVIESFDGSFTDLWNEAKTQWGCSVSRTADMLDWQFIRQPGKKFDILGFIEGDRLMGYAVLYFRKAGAGGSILKAAISDICYHPDKPVEIVDALIGAAVGLSIERRAGSLVTDALDGLLQERLRRAGFMPVKSSVQMLASVPREPDRIYDAKQWYLTRGDSDISIFEEPNL